MPKRPKAKKRPTHRAKQDCRLGEELLRSVARALDNSDLQPLYNAIADDVHWKSASTMKGFFCFGGEYDGRAEVARLMSDLVTDYTITAFRPKEVISSGDVTWGLFWVDLIYKPMRAQVTFDFAIRWRLKDGKVVEHQAFIDTAATFIRQMQLVNPGQGWIG